MVTAAWATPSPWSINDTIILVDFFNATNQFLAQAALRAPYEVAFAMRSWILLLPLFGLSLFFSFFIKVEDISRTSQTDGEADVLINTR